ncbi:MULTISPECIES: transglutaminase-like domain-containing protein [unclassified Thermosipho (in: thermotogales)]|uniref:transglutaminase-like domain-containing protein n=1 Tax=unclassified Thermosipho (in: thermotogales) TaxID=2676525 RepID=UPI000987AA48|nr:MULTISPECIES: transglutaminase-like domain-containing protein [unclassified Thermosipho (in: thermotogales)]MBT1247028.1 transglutaminase [Thermosipho sp. 1244]OOC47048.1 transglutaminase [Thermosipho sp. 1223]
MEFLTVGLPEDILKEEYSGNFGKALVLIEKKLKYELPELLRLRLLYEKERINRLLIDYPYTMKEAVKIAKDKIAGFTDIEFEKLFYEGMLDYIYVNGEYRFESRFAENLGFSYKHYKDRIVQEDSVKKSKKLLDERLIALINGDVPKTYKTHARITLYPDYSKILGETIKVWLPVPKKEFQIKNVKIIDVSHENFVLSPKEIFQNTIYFEDDVANKNDFYVEFEYEVCEWVNRVELDEVEEYFPKKLKQYTLEKPPHILFTPYLKSLAYQIVGKESNPYLKAKLIYDWITTHVSYSYVKPYGTYETIPQFVATNLKGDCGFQALLFITMCRIVGIPTRWQSGWYINKYFASPHDWALFYVQPYGWLPADLSFGGARREEDKKREFYFGNLDGFRMVANTEFMEQFYPNKNFWRSDPYDNQVGEVETEIENVYYDKFKYSIEVFNFVEVE